MKSDTQKQQQEDDEVLARDVRIPPMRFYVWRTFKLLCSGLASIQAQFFTTKRGLIPPVNDKLLDLSVADLVSGIKRRSFTSEDVVRAFIERIKLINPLINAVVDERFDAAVAESQLIDQQLQSLSPSQDSEILHKPLLGIPFTCKDSIAVKGMIQTAGSLHRKGMRATYDAPAVVRLREAGAIPIAITNVPEVLLWWDSTNLLYGDTNNPYDLSRTPGGSSGGEAALIAAAGTPFGLGSDLGGSIRIPSAFNGIFGHKPSQAVVSTDGMFPDVTPELCISHVSFGPMTRYAKDLPLLLKAMAEKDQIERLKLDEVVDMKSLRLYWMENDGGNPLYSEISPEILDKLRSAVSSLRETYGIQCEKVELPLVMFGLEMWSARLSVADPRSVEDLLQQTSGFKVSLFNEFVKSFFGRSTFSFNILFMVAVQRVLGSKVGSTKNRILNKRADLLRQEVIDMLGSNGFLLCPTMPEEAPFHSSTVLKGTDVSLSTVFNVLGVPSLHVPLGLNRNGLPIGVQVVSAPDNDRICFAVAVALEKLFGGFVNP